MEYEGNLANFNPIGSRIYTYRCYEIFNMATIPMPTRALVAGTMGMIIYRKLYKNHIYNRDIYSLAVKYRNEYVV